MPVDVRHYSDPACPWSWGAEPQLRKLMWEFGDGLRFEWVMGGLARGYGSEYRDEEAGITGARDCFDGLMAHWLDVGGETEMPIDPRLWRRNPITSTYPACQAAKAASEQGAALGYAYLRRLREGLMCERKKLDHAEALIGEAGPAGLNVDRFRIDLGSHAITEAFGADLDEVRNPPAAAREAGAVKRTEGHERLSFPSAVFTGEDGERHGVWGWQPHETHRAAALAAGAVPVREGAPAPLEVIDRFGRATTKEVEVLSERPAPIVRAELWKAATEWRLRPIDVLGGTIWELA
jgi:predicted DsbA family dithiol-disulfide isomerase